MKKEIKIAILVLVGFMAFLWLEKPTKEFFLFMNFDSQTAMQSAGILVRSVLIALSLFMIHRLKFIEFTGLNTWTKFQNMHAVIIPLAFISMGLVSNWGDYAQADYHLLILFMISTLAVGIVEELIFRGTLFPLFIKAFKNHKKSMLIAAILSNLIFGVVHFVNIFKQPENIIGITSQVFFALAIGVFFCGLMARTENILIPSFIHALINFSFGADELRPDVQQVSKKIESTGIEWSSVIPTTLFFAFIFVSGVYMISKANKTHLFSKLKA